MKKTVIVLTLALAASAANAADFFGKNKGFYLGASVGKSFYDPKDSDIDIPPLGSYTTNDKGVSYSAYAGYQFNDYFALEGGYVDLGEVVSKFGNGRTNNMSLKGWELSAVGSYPIVKGFSALGKLGVTRLSTRNYETGTNLPCSTCVGYHGDPDASYDNKDDSTHMTYGAGFKYDFNNNLSTRAMIQFYRGTPGENTVELRANTVSLGLQYKF